MKLLKYTLISLLIAFIYLGVARLHESDFIGDGHDSAVYLGFMYIAKQNILQGNWPYTQTNYFRYPQGFDYSYGFDGFLPITTGALLEIFTRPTMAYNITVFLYFFLNILLSWLAFNSIYRNLRFINNVSFENKYLPFIATLIFGLSPYVFARTTNHINLFFIAGFPVALAALVSLYKNSKALNFSYKSIVIFYAGILLIAFGSIQYILFLAGFLPLFASLLIFKIEKSRFVPDFSLFDLVKKTIEPIFIKKNFMKTLLVSLGFFSIFIFIYKGYLIAIFQRKFTVNSWNSGANYLDIFVPNPYLGNLWDFTGSRVSNIEFVVTIGVIEILFLLYLIYKNPSSKMKSVLLITIFFYFLFVLNLFKVPFVPESVRFVVFATLVFCFYILYQTPKMPRYISIIIISLLLMERLFYTIPVFNLPSYKNISLVSKYPGSALLNVPASIWTDYSGTNSALANYHEKKIFEGHLNPGNNIYYAKDLLYSSDIKYFLCDDTPAYYNIDYSISKATVPNVDKSFISNDVRFLIVNNLNLSLSQCSNTKNWWQYYKQTTTLPWKVLYEDSESIGYYR